LGESVNDTYDEGNINRQEIIKWIKQPDMYEPLTEANSRSCLWDWR
jgi:hypothetical protein